MSIANIINKSTQLIDTKYVPPYDEVLGYGQFSSNADVPLLGGNVATPVPYDTTEIAQFCGFSGSTIEVTKAGVWKFAYSVQLDKTGSELING